MTHKTAPELGFIDHLIASAWSILPEETAASVAGVKKDFLTRLKSTIDSLVDHEINDLNRHVENAKDLRNRNRESTGHNPEAHSS